jgi:tRNA C32,U32 (ribose-2'-O)-methylase TrmJ
MVEIGAVEQQEQEQEQEQEQAVVEHIHTMETRIIQTIHVIGITRDRDKDKDVLRGERLCIRLLPLLLQLPVL